jgi:hypothetical protein
VPYIDYQWEADTAVMTSYSKDNDGYAYFLLVIDVFSRFVWTVPLRSTRADEMVEALKSLLDKGRVPEKLRTDKGVEFKNRRVQTLMRERNIDHFFTQNESKANYAERAIKNVKLRLSRYRSRHQSHRWVDVLDDVTKSYNATYHRSLKRAPEQVKKRDEQELWKLQYQRQPSVPRPTGLPKTRYRFNVGDEVRISHLQRPFQREYDERWTYEYFVVNSRGMKQGIPYYTLKDLRDEEVTGTFYDSELSKVLVTEETTYRIEKILKKERTRVLVKWWGWPKTFNSWISRGDLRHYGSKA